MNDVLSLDLFDNATIEQGKMMQIGAEGSLYAHEIHPSLNERDHHGWTVNGGPLKLYYAIQAMAAGEREWRKAMHEHRPPHPPATSSRLTPAHTVVGGLSTAAPRSPCCGS